MNIKFGMDNFYTRYLKRFLNHHMVRTNSILGDFEREDLKALIKYLNTPNTDTVFEVKNKILDKFVEIQSLFNLKVGDDMITFTSKVIDTYTSAYLSTNIEAIRLFCKSVGWCIKDVSNWIDKNYDINDDGVINHTDRRVLTDIIYNNMVYDEETMRKADVNLDGNIDEKDLEDLDYYINNNKIYFTIESEGRENVFPNKDMLVFINQFDGDFLEDYAIRDADGVTDVIHRHEPDPDTGNGTRIGIYKCRPGQKVTIAHDCSKLAHLVIGCSSKIIKQDLTSLMLDDVVEVDLEPGDSYQYTTTQADGSGTKLDAQWLCIQVPSNYANISGRVVKKVYLDVGDINFDGRIDMEDYNMLAQYTAYGDGAENLPWNKANWTPTDRQLAVMNCRTDNQWHRERIDTDDAVMLYNYINNIGGVTDLGLTPWEINTDATYDDSVNVSNILIIDGHYDMDVNIPFSEFTTDPWIIHDKFFNYLFGMAVHKYSNSEDITYIQKLLKEVTSETVGNSLVLGIYNEEMRLLMKQYQSNKMYYTTGDLNKDGKLDSKDLEIMQQFVMDCTGYTKVCKYLSDPDKYPLTPEEIIELDVDEDGLITENDKLLIEAELNKVYSPVLRERADINGDGFIDETDYNYLNTIIRDGSANIEKQIKTGDGTYVTIYQYCDLKNREVPFQLGWLDVQTEALLEFDVNSFGDISEVTK